MQNKKNNWPFYVYYIIFIVLPIFLFISILDYRDFIYNYRSLEGVAYILMPAYFIFALILNFIILKGNFPKTKKRDNKFIPTTNNKFCDINYIL